MRTKGGIIFDLDGVSDGWQTTYEPTEVEKAMDQWAKQALEAFLVEVKIMKEGFEKEKRELLDLLNPLGPLYTCNFYVADTPTNSEVIDKWYEQYLNKVNTKTPV